MSLRVVVFDAMGVLYRHGDVCGGVLVPYAREHGCTRSEHDIRRAYHSVTSGQLSTSEFWRQLGLEAGPGGAGRDADYCQRHELTPDTLESLQELASEGLDLACLSNDAAPWSRLLRRRFGLEKYIQDWFISSDLAARKPDPLPYRLVVDVLAVAPEQLLFIDDRPVNLAAAAGLGMRTMLFVSDDTLAAPNGTPDQRVTTMAGLVAAVRGLGGRR